MEKEISMLIVSCDKYSDLWEPFFKCFYKYWDDCPFQVYLTTNYLEYDDPNIKTIKIGEDISYADNLIKAIENIDTPYIFLWLEDCMFSSKIDNKRVLSIFNDAIKRKEVGYLKLSDDLPLSYQDDASLEIGEIPKGVKYRSAIGMTLYKKDVLEKLLVPGYNAWELDKSSMSNEFSEPFYALTTNFISNPPLPYVNTVIKGAWHTPTIKFFRKEKLEHLLKNRKKQTLLQYFYIKLFYLRVSYLIKLRKYWYES